jgi:hypothetical protein
MVTVLIVDYHSMLGPVVAMFVALAKNLIRWSRV